MLKYYAGRTTADKSLIGPLPLGSRVHAALEMWLKSGADMQESYKELLRIDKEIFDESWEGGFEDKEKEFNSEAELGRTMLEGFQDWLDDTGGLAEYEIHDIENALKYDVLGGRIQLIGKLDLELIDKNDGSVYIGDYKTAISFKPYIDTSHMSEQLLLYTMLRRLQDDRRTDGGVYIILKKTKRTARATPPFYEKMVIRFNDKFIASFWERAMGTLEDMLRVRDALDSGVDHRRVAYPSVKDTCSWRCEFKAVCPMMDDGSDWERWVDTRTKVHNPYERYGDQLDE